MKNFITERKNKINWKNREGAQKNRFGYLSSRTGSSEV